MFFEIAAAIDGAGLAPVPTASFFADHKGRSYHDGHHSMYWAQELLLTVVFSVVVFALAVFGLRLLQAYYQDKKGYLHQFTVTSSVASNKTSEAIRSIATTASRNAALSQTASTFWALCQSEKEKEHASSFGVIANALAKMDGTDVPKKLFEKEKAPRKFEDKPSIPNAFPHNVSINKALVRATGCEEILKIVDQRLNQFNPTNLVTAMHRLAKRGLRTHTQKADRRFRNLRSKISWMLTTSETKEMLKPQELCNTVWALATMAMHEDVEIFSLVAKEAVPRFGEFKPQELSTTAWAFAKLGLYDEALFKGVAEEAAQRLDEFNPQNLSNTLWAFAKVGHYHEQLFKRIAMEAVPRLCDFRPQELANTVWAFAKVGVHDEQLFTAIARTAVPRLCAFTAQELSNTVWAFAKVGNGDETLFQGVAVEATPRLKEFNPQNMSNTLWAFSKTGLTDRTLFEAIAKEAVPRLKEFKAADFANTVWAFAKVGMQDEAIFKEVAMEAVPHLNDFKPHGVVQRVCRRLQKTSC